MLFGFLRLDRLVRPSVAEPHHFLWLRLQVKISMFLQLLPFQMAGQLFFLSKKVEIWVQTLTTLFT
jgi:hypothetical protein